jgi:cell wall-associated NlpC family hydrolase
MAKNCFDSNSLCYASGCPRDILTAKKPAFSGLQAEKTSLTIGAMKKITCALALLSALGGAGPARADDVFFSASGQDAVRLLSDAYADGVRDVIFYALSMVGIRYHWGGSSPQAGFDCSGLVSHVFKKIAGQILPRDSYGMARLGKPVSLDELRPGDLVFFNTMRRPYSHVGIYLGEKRFLHAPSAGKSVHIVDMTDAYWAARYNGARRIDL